METADPTPGAWLLRLVQIVDSAFPTGAFGHSTGLEYAIQNGWVTTARELEAWTTTVLDYSVIPLDGRATLKAWLLTERGDLQGWMDLNDELSSFRPSLGQRRASAEMGRALWDSAVGSFETAGVEWPVDPCLDAQFPAVWGRLCALLGIPAEPAVLALLHAFIRSWAQVALRIVPLGQQRSFRYATVLTERLATGARDWDWEARQPLETISPGHDIAQIGQETLRTRYFRS